MLASGRFKRTFWLSVGGLATLAVLWVVVTGLLARQQVQKLEDRLQTVKVYVAQGRITDAEREAAGIRSLAERAHLLTSGPAWWAMSEIPYLGDPFGVMRGATSAGKFIGTDGVSTLLRIANTLDPRTLRASGSTVRLAPLQQAAPQLKQAAQQLDRAIKQVDGLPSNTWFGPVNHARLDFSLQLHSIVGYVDAAANATQILPTMLGDDHTQRYFIAMQNESEMRGTGGLPGAFAIAETRNGKLTFTHFGSDAELLPAATKQRVHTGLDFGKDYDSAYGNGDPTNYIVNSNLSPNFPYAAQIWSKMWTVVSGQHIDGAIAVDPSALGAFLAVTGPVTLPSGVAVNANNIVSLTEKDEYTLFSDNNARKDFLVSILKASSTKLTSGAGSASALARAITRVSNQNRLQVWSSDPSIEKVLAGTSYGGSIPDSDRPFSGVIVNNNAAGKLDYYMVRTLDYTRTGCGPLRDVLATITITNNAPPFGLPPYVLGRLDIHDSSVQPGDNRTLMDYYATTGAQLLSVSINDKPSTSGVQTDLGHTIFRLDLELPRGQTQTIALHLEEPAGIGTPQIWQQPGVTPMLIHAFSQTC